jgi:hypothetical protein
MKALLLAVVLGRRHRDLAESTRRNTPGDWSMPSMPSCRWHRRSATAAACAGDTPASPITCSPSSIIPRSPPTTTAANTNRALRDISQGHRRFPFRRGRRPVRRRPLRHRHRRAPRHPRLSGNPSHPTRPICAGSGLSSYARTAADQGRGCTIAPRRHRRSGRVRAPSCAARCRERLPNAPRQWCSNSFCTGRSNTCFLRQCRLSDWSWCGNLVQSSIPLHDELHHG